MKTIEQLFNDLCSITDNAWALYAFRNDTRSSRFLTQRDMLVLCKNVKEDIERFYNTLICSHADLSTLNLLNQLCITLSYETIISNPAQPVLARFFSPDRIIIDITQLRKLTNNESVKNLINEKQIEKIIVGHELYHVLEDRNQYLQSQQKFTFKRYKFLPAKRMRIQALSEYGAMYFSRLINNLPYSPYILDFLIWWSKNKTEASNIYNEIISIESKIKNI